MLLLWICFCLTQSLDDELNDLQASDASSASLKRPGKNQVMERSEDSRVEMVETLFIRKASYLALEDAMALREEE